MRTAAILPVKRFTQAKQRLSGVIDDPLRLELAEAMVRDVLDALAQTAPVELIVVVTRESVIARAAVEQGAIVVGEEGERAGQSAAAALGIARAAAEGAERVLCVPGDCPALDPGELGDLLGAEGPEVVIVPDRHGTGTNGLLLSPPGAIEPSFGPGSCERHLGLAEQAGARARVARPASLLLDIDTGADLDVLRGRLAGQSGRAPRTRAVLAGSGLPPRLPSPA